jgi:hypothetical protein
LCLFQALVGREQEFAEVVVYGRPGFVGHASSLLSGV